MTESELREKIAGLPENEASGTRQNNNQQGTRIYFGLTQGPEISRLWLSRNTKAPEISKDFRSRDLKGHCLPRRYELRWFATTFLHFASKSHLSPTPLLLLSKSRPLPFYYDIRFGIYKRPLSSGMYRRSNSPHFIISNFQITIYWETAWISDEKLI